MLLLVGLGNPGAKYAGNRHNIGFQLIDLIAAHYRFGRALERFHGLLQEGYLDGATANVQGLAKATTRTKTRLLKPQTFYNDAGKSVAAAAHFHKISTENIVVIHDDIDLAPGKVKIKRGGSAAGNNGLKSIASHLGPDFRRLRIGIGHPGDKARVTGYVLGNFEPHENAAWRTCTLDALMTVCPYLGLDDPQADAKFLSRVAALIDPQHPSPKSPSLDTQKDKKSGLAFMPDKRNDADRQNKSSRNASTPPPDLSPDPSSLSGKPASPTAFADKLKSLLRVGPSSSSKSHKDTE